MKQKHTSVKLKISGFYKIDGFEVKCGTNDKDNNDVLFIRSKTKVSAMCGVCQNLNDNIDTFVDEFYQFVSSVIKNRTCFQNRFLADVDVSKQRINNGKATKLKYDVFFKLNESNSVYNIEEKQLDLAKILNNWIKDNLFRFNLDLTE